MNRWGIHWANVDPGERLGNLALYGDCYLVMDGGFGWIPRIREARPNAVIVHRHAVSNWMDMEPEVWAEQMADLFHQHKQHTKHVELECEPDIFPFFPGWGQPIVDRLKFAADWNIAVAENLREFCPGVIIHSPPLGHERIDLPDWFRIWKPVLDACDVLDMHCYWEKGGKYYRPGLYDYTESYHRAFRYRKIHDFLELRNYWIPMMVTECGNFAPDRPDYADELIYYFRGLEQDASYMIGGCPFILKSDAANWVNDIARRQPDIEAFFNKLRTAHKEDLSYPKKEVPVRADLPLPTDVQLDIELNDLRATIQRHPTKVYARRSISQIDTIVIHHYGVTEASPEAIARYHVTKAKPWPGPGYHLCIGKDGSIYWLNSLEVKSYQTRYHNDHTIGIGFEGDFTEEDPTEAQYESGRRLVSAINSAINGRLPIRGHKQMPDQNTQCPGDFDISRLLPQNNLKIQLAKNGLRELIQLANEILSELEE